MKKLFFMLLALCSAVSISAQFESAPAFPGAEGFARLTTTGGRGGKVYHVTNLEDNASGQSAITGSLRWACQQSGIRTIVFDVSGTIYLKQALSLQGDNVSILGQTAPGDGICIADYPFTIKCKNVILRYLRFRLGNRHVADHEGDGLGGMDQENIIVDHCSVSWSVDECLSVYGSKNISVQWNIVDQSMVNSGHSKGAHGYGGNWGGSGASYHHNLLAFHTSRCPRLGPRPGTQTDERMDLRNCVMYNWSGNGCYGGEGMNVNIVNNYYKPGPGTGSSVGKRIAAVNIRTTSYCERVVNADGTVTGNGWLPMWHVWGHYYVNGNVNSKYPEVTNDNWGNGFINQIKASDNDGTFTSVTKDTIKLTEPIKYGWITTQKAEVAYEKVVKYAGASYSRDSHDTYIANDVKNGTATYTSSGLGKGFVNNQDDAGGWPDLKSTAAKADTDGDGIPDDWEDRYYLDSNDAEDGKSYTLDKKGYYTNFEVYCNSLVEDMIKAQNADADTTVAGYFEEYYPVFKAKYDPAVDGDIINMTKIILDKDEVKMDKKYGSVNAIGYEPENASLDLRSVTFSSDNKEVAEVLDPKKGDFVVMGEGIANIIATAQDSAHVTATAKVIVPRKGDANCNGDITMADANLVVNNATATEIYKDPADANSDGVINEADAKVIVDGFLTGEMPTVSTSVMWDPLYSADIIKAVTNYGTSMGSPTLFFDDITTSTSKFDMASGSYGILTSVKDSITATVAPISTYPNLGYVTDNLKTNGTATYNAYQGNFLCLNLGTDGWAEFTTTKIPAGRYKVVLHALSDALNQKSLYTAGTETEFTLDNNSVTVPLLKGTTYSKYSTYKTVVQDLWDAVEFPETGRHTFRITLRDATASTSAAYHLYIDYIEFIPVEYDLSGFGLTRFYPKLGV